MQGHQAKIANLSISVDQSFIISSDDNKIIKMWNLKEKREEFSTKETSRFALNNDSTMIAIGNDDRSLKFIKIKHSSDVSEEYVTYGCTSDSKFGLYYTTDTISAIKNLENPTHSNLLGTQHLFDNSFQPLLEFYGTLDSIKHENYLNLSLTSSSISFTRFSFTIVHVLSYLGKSNELQALQNPYFILKTDAFGNSPIFYSITRKHQNCTDILIRFLISLFENSSSQQFQACLFAIRNDFILIIENSSRELNVFLQNLLISSTICFARVNEDLPIYGFNEFYLPLANEFNVGKTIPDIEEIPVVLQYTPFDITCSLGSAESIRLFEAIIYCENTQIFRAPIIQYIIQYHWSSLKLWVSINTLLLFLNLFLLVLIMALNEKDLFSITIFIIVNLLLLLWEIAQMLANRLGYLADAWNVIDIARFILTLI